MSRKDKTPRDEPEAAFEPDAQPEGEAPPQAPAPAGETEALRAERDDLMARLQRVSADYLNYQKRIQREVTQAREFANESLIKALLGVLDDMERATEAARSNHAPDDPLLTGMGLLHDNFLTLLGRFGLEVIEAEGKPFDPELHSAMMREPSAEAPPGTVLRELQKGYRLKDRTLRPSTVVLSAAPGETQDRAEDESTE